jgi:dTDP-4-amino-4,6-dideoxygalactose transaminase
MLTRAARARPIPMLDLAAEQHEVGGVVRAAIDEVLASRQYVLGPHVERFEAAIAAYCGVPHAVGVASGTDALVLALMALGVGPGSVVLTTPFSFFATASTIVRLGARPLFADIDPRTMNLDPAAAEAALATARGNVAGLLPVHLFGRLAPMDALGALAARHGLWIVEDAAQAVGARVDGRAAGAFGRAACLSFYPTKNLGALGDGGLVLTRDAAIAERLRRDRHQGQVVPYEHETIGLCSRLDALQAAVLGAKLPFLDGWNARRRIVAGWYDAQCRAAGLAGSADAPLVLPEPAGSAHVFHQYVVRARDRDRLAVHLREHGVATQVYYRIPLHRQVALAPFAVRAGELPEAERAAASVLALPIYPSLGEGDVAAVVELMAAFYRTL